MRFYIKPAQTELPYDWTKMHPDEWRSFKQTIKDAFVPVKGSGTNAHFSVSSYALPHPFREVEVGFVSHEGKRWNLRIEETPGASITVFGFSEFSLRITEDGCRKNGTRK